MNSIATQTNPKTIPTMSTTEDATELADLMRQQFALTEKIAKLTDPAAARKATDELNKLRNQCIALVDKYFRRELYPMIAKRFPGKVGKQAPAARFTQLLNDFFILVKTKYDDEFWKRSSPARLRDYASTVISRDMIDMLRRRDNEQGVNAAYLLKQELAKEASERMAQDRLDLERVLEILERWDEMGSEQERKHAHLLRLYYIAGMDEDQVERDAGMTLKQVSEAMSVPLPTVARWKQSALQALRLELEAS